MNAAFLEALQKKTQSIQNQRNTLPQGINSPKIIKPEPITEVKKQEIRIEFVINKKRIDLFFIPSADDKTIDLLVNHNWQWELSSNHFCKEDTNENRKFLIKHFNAKIELLEEETPETFQKSDLILNDVSPEFATYRMQVNKLLETLKCEPAGLMLIAINCLYNEHFL